MLPQKALNQVDCWCDIQLKSVLPLECSTHSVALKSSPSGQTEALGVGSPAQAKMQVSQSPYDHYRSRWICSQQCVIHFITRLT